MTHILESKFYEMSIDFSTNLWDKDGNETEHDKITGQNEIAFSEIIPSKLTNFSL